MGRGLPGKAPEKLRLPRTCIGRVRYVRARTCVGEAGQSRGEEVLYNALELNSNRFYNKGDN